MRFDIQSSGFPLTAPILDHTDQRLRFALIRTSDSIKRVVVRLGDVKVARGSEDKFCRIRVFLEHAPPVSVEDAGADLYAVIERAVERTGRKVALRVDRLRENAGLTRLQPPAVPSGEAGNEFSN